MDKKYGNVMALKEFMLNKNRVSKIEALVLFGVQDLNREIKRMRMDGFIIKNQKVTLISILGFTWVAVSFFSILLLDYKIRYALQDTIYWGSYMTDIIKDYEEVIKYADNNNFQYNLFDDFKKKVDDFQPDLMITSTVEDTFLQLVSLMSIVRDKQIPLYRKRHFLWIFTNLIVFFFPSFLN